MRIIHFELHVYNSKSTFKTKPTSHIVLSFPDTICGPAEYLVNLVNGSSPVPDSSLTASSTLVYNNQDFRPPQGRLYNQYQTFASGPYTKAPGIWAPASANANQFIQVSMSIMMYYVSAMKTVKTKIIVRF